jgi:surfactin synthase thioesterase subunit
MWRNYMKWIARILPVALPGRNKRIAESPFS